MVQWDKFWTRTVYEWVADEPERLRFGHAIVREEHGDQNSLYARNQTQARDELRVSGLISEFPDLFVGPAEMAYGAVQPIEGGHRVPAWAWSTATTWIREFFNTPIRAMRREGVRNTFRDWTSPYLDLDKIRRERNAWASMWFDSVRPSEAPRNWIRWAVHFLQHGQKVLPSNAMDQQLVL